MTTTKSGIKAADLIPASIIGAPVTLVLAGGLHLPMPIAIAVGVAAGLAAVVALLAERRRG